MTASNSIETVVICKQVLSENRIDRLTVIALIAVLVVGCFVVLRPFLSALLWAVILFFSTWLGVIAFGLLGVFLGPTLLAIAYPLFQEWSSQKHKSKVERSIPPVKR